MVGNTPGILKSSLNILVVGHQLLLHCNDRIQCMRGPEPHFLRVSKGFLLLVLDCASVEPAIVPLEGPADMP
jgi:hypothetical protein